MVSTFVPIQIAAGTQPSLDSTALLTLHYTATDKVFFKGKDQQPPKLAKIDGWVSSPTYTENAIGFLGACRSVWSYQYLFKRTLFGTSSRLYCLQQGELFNITPLQTSSTAAANSLATNYTTLANDPIATVNGSTTVTIAHTAHKLLAGDSVTFSGVSGTIGGVAAATFNATFIVRTVAVNSFTIRLASAASGTASGGGASVIEKTALITLTKATHGLQNGDRVWVNGAAATGGVPALEINIEHIIRNVDTNTLSFMCVTKATSSVSSSGGASTVYYPPIVAGEINFSAGLGYGGGKYGVGLYGVPKSFSSVLNYPTVWSFGRFGNDVVMTMGGGTKVYVWDGDLSLAPTVLTNSPAAADWVAVSNNAVIVLNGNTVYGSSVGDATVWTPSASSTAYLDTIEGVGDLISQAKSGTVNLLFTEAQVLTFSYVNLPDLWLADFALRDDGIIGPKARIEMEDFVFWMGQKDFYVFDGSNVQKCPNNTCHAYIFENINRSQAYKTFIKPDPSNDQFWVYFPTGSSNEPNEYVIVNYKRWDWTLGTMERTASEEPTPINGDFIYMANAYEAAVNGDIYRHGASWTDAAGAAMQCYAETNYKWLVDGKKTLEILKIIPDSIQTGDITFTAYMKEWPQASVVATLSQTVSPTTSYISLHTQARLRKYRWETNVIGGAFQAGMWSEEVQFGGDY
jgi:hypothetical protein